MFGLSLNADLCIRLRFLTIVYHIRIGTYMYACMKVFRKTCKCSCCFAIDKKLLFSYNYISNILQKKEAFYVILGVY